MPLGEKEAMMWWDKPSSQAWEMYRCLGQEFKASPSYPLFQKDKANKDPPNFFFGVGVGMSSHLCSPGYPATSSIDQSVLKLRDSPASAS